MKNESKHSEMGPVRQNSIQRTVSTTFRHQYNNNNNKTTIYKAP